MTDNDVGAGHEDERAGAKGLGRNNRGGRCRLQCPTVMAGPVPAICTTASVA